MPLTNGIGSSHEAEKIPEPRLLLDIISSNATLQSSKIWAAVPNSKTDATQGYRDVTFVQLHNAVNRAAKWLKDTLGPANPSTFETLAYMGPPDTRYVILNLAAIKAEFQMLFLSPRNSDEAQWSVIREAKCTIFLCAAPMLEKVRELTKKPFDNGQHKDPGGSSYPKILTVSVPEEQDFLDDSLVPEFPYSKTAEQARRDPLVILHTSSTTGLPKTIPLNQGYGFHDDVLLHLPKVDGRDLITRKPFYGHCRMLVTMPLFHGGGILMGLLKPLYQDITVVFQPANVPLSARTVNDILRHARCTGCVIPPSLLEDMLPVPEYMDTLANLDFVQFGSGPLSKGAGDALLTRQKNCPHYIGSSEASILPLLELPDPVQDWQFFNFHPWSGVDFRPVDGDGTLFRLFIVRTKNIMGLQPVFELFPDMEEWDTRELYVKHDTQPGLWRCCGRIDDVLVLSNGEKLNPVETEAAITNCGPNIKSALVIGAGRFMPGLLLETNLADVGDPAQRRQVMDELRSTLQRVNEAAPKHGQLTEALVLLTNSKKPFLRTPKLSIMRQKTVEAFDKEISNMYEEFDAGPNSSDDAMLPTNIDWQTEESTQNFFAEIIMNCTGWRRMPQTDEDLFSLGLDSFHVVRIVRATRAALIQKQEPKEQDFQNRTVYENSTLIKLSHSLQSLLLNPTKTLTNGHVNGQDISSEKLLDQLVGRLTEFQWASNTFQTPKKTDFLKATVILTGSTGSFGTYLLSTLIANSHIAHIFCCDRAEDARSRNIQSAEVQGLTLDATTLDKRVTFLQTKDLSAPFLGLEESVYSTLQATVTHVLHNAWPVNFNLNLGSFVPHVEGVRKLVDFCATTTLQSKLVFVSSISSVARYRGAGDGAGLVPARIVEDSSVPGPMGYAQSKSAAERILSAATTASAKLSSGTSTPIQTVVLRVGQIAGPVGAAEGRGLWTMREWFPRLIATSKVIGALPETLGRMDEVEWVPVDMLAGIVSELVGFSPTTEGGINDRQDTDVHNLVNPTAVSWSTHLLPVVKTQLGIDVSISLAEWVARIRGWTTEHDVPAAKILDFYQGLVLLHEESTSGKRFEMEKTLSRSKTMRELGPVREEWVVRWLQQWNLKT